MAQARRWDSLRTTFETQKERFEDDLGLKPEEWVALPGAHSVGRAAGVRSDHHKAGQLRFDPNPTLFENECYKSLALASDSALLSLCPQARRPGDAHWFGPPRGATKDYTVLLDADVAMTVEDKCLDCVKEHAMDEDAFKCQFSVALLKATELGILSESLMAVGNASARPVVACAGSKSSAKSSVSTMGSTAPPQASPTDETGHSGDGESTHSTQSAKPTQSTAAGESQAREWRMPVW